jgi:hypothetical protein
MLQNTLKTRLAIGDIHGRTYWKNYLSGDFTEYYILGDYFDSFFVPFEDQYANFCDICHAARLDNRIKLCLGNHDYHYLSNIKEQRYSGFQEEHYQQIQDILEDNIDLLKIVYVTHDRIIISHAGVSRTFLKKIDALALHIDDINKIFALNRNSMSFDGMDVFGDDITQSPIWIRPRSLLKDAVREYHQIVGHTPKGRIEERRLPDGRKIVFINTEEIDTIYQF